MNLSCACAYALRSLVFLARRDGVAPVPSGQIAEAEGLPERFLGRVLKPLVSAQVLLSLRGPNGGYRLARPAKGIPLLDVVEAVDGPVRGETPRWAAAAAGKLNSRLQQVCDAGAEEVRGSLRKVSLAYLAGTGKG
jgi:Rrf2 family protein